MTTQRIQLDISNDIFDKVMFFLENLPKNKIKITLDTSSKRVKLFYSKIHTKSD